MNTYELETTSATQAAIMETLQREKIDFIQTASGLCLKTERPPSELMGLMGGAKLKPLEVDENAPKDVAAFAEKEPAKK